MNFGQAIEELKANKTMQRKGWNGKGMHIYLEAGIEKGTKIYEPVICMYTANKTIQPGWLASQADILAEDWDVVV